MSVYHLPTKPYDVIDAINRHAAATGSMRYASLTGSADYNGHYITMSFNDYRGYYVAEYTWAGRIVVARGDARYVLAQAIKEYEQQGKGASLVVHLREQDAAVAREFPQLVEGPLPKNPTFFTWKHEKVWDAMWYEKQLGVPATMFLIEATNPTDYDARVQACLKERRAGVRT